MVEKKTTAVGYARVSTENQKLAPQVLKLEKYLEKNFDDYDIYKEKVSSIKERKELEKIFDNLEKYDAFVVTDLDRFSRSLKDLLIRHELLTDQDVNLVVIDKALDTGTKEGKLMMNMLGSVAQYEREMIRERMNSGYKEALNEGKVGRQRKITGKAWKDFKRWWKSDNHGVASIRALLKEKYDIEISRQTLYNYGNELDKKGE